MRKNLDRILLCISLILIFTHGTHIEGDGEIRYQGLKELLRTGKFPDLKYSLIGPLFSTPLFFLDQFFQIGLKLTSAFNALFFLGAVAFFWKILRSQLSHRTTLNFLLILTCFSMFPAHLQQYYGEVFSSLTLAIGFLLFHLGKPKRGGVLIALGLANSPGLMFAGMLVFLVKLIESRNLKTVWILVMAASLILVENFLKRGSFFQSGYGSSNEHGWKTLLPYSGLPGFSYPFFLGILSILFSFGKGLVFFSPGSFISAQAWFSSDSLLKKVYRDWALLLLGTILFYSKWWAWYGGWFWGPRFFLFSSLLASLVLALGLEHAKTLRLQVLIAGALLLSSWVGIEGALFGNVDLFEIASRNHSEQEAFIWYLPEFSVLWRPWILSGVWTKWKIIQAVFYGFIYLYLIRDWLSSYRQFVSLKKGNR